MLKRALIVDEDSRTSSLVESVLGSVGIESVKLDKSADAFEVLQHARFLVAFLGSQLSFPDAPELTRRLRDSTYNSLTPVILLSSDPSPRAMVEGFQAGATFFLYKPIDKDCLLRLVRATHGAMEMKLLRRTRRVPLASKVLLYFRGQEIEGQTINASLEGLLIKTARAIPVGSSVDMHVHLGKTPLPLKASGSVVRHGPRGEIGVQLGRLSAHESQRFEEFLLPLLPHPLTPP